MEKACLRPFPTAAMGPSAIPAWRMKGLSVTLLERVENVGNADAIATKHAAGRPLSLTVRETSLHWPRRGDDVIDSRFGSRDRQECGRGAATLPRLMKRKLLPRPEPSSLRQVMPRP